MMFIMLRLIDENLSTLSAKISFLWDRNHGVYAVSFEASVTSCYIRNTIQRFTSVIYYYINTIRTA